jgi:hypothetical protein
MINERIHQLYDSILGQGSAGTERFFAALRERNIPPRPNPARHDYNLYAPNPVIVAGPLVQAMTADANAFCQALQRRIPDAASLLERAPAHIQQHYASAEVATQLLADLRRAHPLVCLDAFLVDSGRGLQPAYLEWQTVGTYVTTGLLVVEAAAAAWPEIRDYANLTAWPDIDPAGLRQHLRNLYTQGIADDPRQGVIVDYRPEICATRREFWAIQELTGGAERGMGVIDPREIVQAEGGFHYRRDGALIPIRRVYSRMVYSDIVQLEQESSAAEIATIRRFFQTADQHTWISHILHFFYGSKADLPEFWAQGLSPRLPESVVVTPSLIAEYREHFGSRPIEGYVQKPLNAQSGRDVLLNPTPDQLVLAAILQREIVPAASHRTLFGPRTPEIRVMALPDASGQLICGLIYNRIKSPEVFLSNAGSLARSAIPGTGEGYGIVVY